jgi:two-component system, chemotaxis family, chemotaxis protein CheY
MAKVMIVDDSAYARRVHRAILESGGHVVVEAASGSAALELFSLERPEAVLLDLTMGDIGGLEVLRLLRELDADPHVIVVSADIQKSTAIAVKEAGAERFLAKPVGADDLLATIAEITGGAPG